MPAEMPGDDQPASQPARHDHHTYETTRYTTLHPTPYTSFALSRIIRRYIQYKQVCMKAGEARCVCVKCCRAGVFIEPIAQGTLSQVHARGQKMFTVFASRVIV